MREIRRKTALLTSHSLASSFVNQTRSEPHGPPTRGQNIMESHTSNHGQLLAHLPWTCEGGTVRTSSSPPRHSPSTLPSLRQAVRRRRSAGHGSVSGPRRSVSRSRRLSPLLTPPPTPSSWPRGPTGTTGATAGATAGPTGTTGGTGGTTEVFRSGSLPGISEMEVRGRHEPLRGGPMSELSMGRSERVGPLDLW